MNTELIFKIQRKLQQKLDTRQKSPVCHTLCEPRAGMFPSAASCATIMERNEMSVCKIPTYDTRWMTKKKVGKKIINFLVNQILIQNMPITKKVHPLFSIIFDQNFFPKIFCSVILLIKINKKKLKVFIFFNIFDLLYRFFNV